MADAQQAQAPNATAPDAGTQGERDVEISALGALFARVAEARWSSLLGSGHLEFVGDASELGAAAARATGVVYIGGNAGGWLRAAIDLSGAGGARAQDHKALAAWLEGVGEGLAQLLTGAVEVRLVQAGDRPEAEPSSPEGAVLGFAGTFGRRSGKAWLWMEPGLFDLCLQALAEGTDAEPAEPQTRPQPASVGGEEASASRSDGTRPHDGRTSPFPPLPEAGLEAEGGRLDVLLDVPLQVSVELGRTERQIREILSLVPGSVLELDRLAGDPLDVLINGKRIARAEVVVVDERFAIRITEILAPEDRIAPVG